MAGKLGDDNKVVQMPTRAAKGAGKNRARKPPAQVKPPIPKGKGGLRARPKDAKDERALRDALQLQLIGLRSKHTAVDQKIAAKREEIRELNETRKVIRAAIETAGMPLALFDEAYEDGKTSRVDLARKEASRSIVREAYGLPTGTQGELFTGEEKTPEAAKPGIYWEAEGYRAGISGLDPDKMPKPPPEHIQDFQRGLNNATARNAEGLKELKKVETRARTPIHRPGAEAATPDEAAELDAAKRQAAANGGGEKHDDEEEGIEDDEEEAAREQGPPASEEPAPDVLTRGPESAAVH